jgi:MFS family permease
MPTEPDNIGASRKRALRFVLLIGVLSFFADFTYEGARSVLGPYLAILGASATIVGIVTGFGELLGYSLRLVSGRWADATGKFWPITIFGYVLQMASVPALALTRNWQEAAVLIILERVGKAIRNPPRDGMLSHAAKQVGGYGWVFGIHEAMDQSGAMVGPLLVAAVLAGNGSYHEAFAVLLLPAILNLSFVAVARLAYPRPQDLEAAARGRNLGHRDRRSRIDHSRSRHSDGAHPAQGVGLRVIHCGVWGELVRRQRSDRYSL